MDSPTQRPIPSELQKYGDMFLNRNLQGTQELLEARELLISCRGDRCPHQRYSQLMKKLLGRSGSTGKCRSMLDMLAGPSPGKGNLSYPD